MQFGDVLIICHLAVYHLSWLLHKSTYISNFVAVFDKLGMKSVGSLFMHRCYSLVCLFVFLLICSGNTTDNDYRTIDPEEEATHIQEVSNIGHIDSICAAIFLVISVASIVFCVVDVRRRHAVERKNRDLANQVAQATYYKTQYIKLQSEKETAASNDETNTETLSPVELFDYMSRIIQTELLFLQVDFGRQKLMDRFRLSKERVGQAFAQGSSYKSVAEYVRDLRLEYSANLLATHPEFSIREVSKASGFSNLSVYSRSFRNKYGVTPSEYRTRR